MLCAPHFHVLYQFSFSLQCIPSRFSIMSNYHNMPVALVMQAFSMFLFAIPCYISVIEHMTIYYIEIVCLHTAESR